jgi:hypothetical protein
MKQNQERPIVEEKVNGCHGRLERDFALYREDRFPAAWLISRSLSLKLYSRPGTTEFHMVMVNFSAWITSEPWSEIRGKGPMPSVESQQPGATTVPATTTTSTTPTRMHSGRCHILIKVCSASLSLFTTPYGKTIQEKEGRWQPGLQKSRRIGLAHRQSDGKSGFKLPYPGPSNPRSAISDTPNEKHPPQSRLRRV